MMLYRGGQAVWEQHVAHLVLFVTSQCCRSLFYTTRGLMMLQDRSHPAGKETCFIFAMLTRVLMSLDGSFDLKGNVSVSSPLPA